MTAHHITQTNQYQVVRCAIKCIWITTGDGIHNHSLCVKEKGREKREKRGLRGKEIRREICIQTNKIGGWKNRWNELTAKHQNQVVWKKIPEIVLIHQN